MSGSGLGQARQVDRLMWNRRSARGWTLTDGITQGCSAPKRLWPRGLGVVVDNGDRRGAGATCGDALEQRDLSRIVAAPLQPADALR
jgi:hypothetical protein